MANEITTDVKQGVFILGAGSAFARAVTRRLVAAGYPVTAAVAGSDGAKAVRADGALPAFPDLQRAGEIRSAIKAAGAEVVLNLAPQIDNHVPHAGGDIDPDNRRVDALLEAAQAAEVKYLIHTSYVWDYTGEQAVLKANIPACVLRFGYLYGANDPAMQALRDGLKVGRPIPRGSDEAKVAYITIGDAAEAVLRTVDVRPQDEILEITDDEPATPAEFITYFAESQGLPVPGRLPRFALRALVRGNAADRLDAYAHGDNHAAKAQLNWQPQFPNYRTGIDDMLLTWRAAQVV